MDLQKLMRSGYEIILTRRRVQFNSGTWVSDLPDDTCPNLRKAISFSEEIMIAPLSAENTLTISEIMAILLPMESFGSREPSASTESTEQKESPGGEMKNLAMKNSKKPSTCIPR